VLLRWAGGVRIVIVISFSISLGVFPGRTALLTYLGQVQDGVVVLRGQSALLDGTEVVIQPIPSGKSVVERGPKLADQFADVIGTVPELAADMTANHDHYLHGAPKK
jgi:hypothetical protein